MALRLVACVLLLEITTFLRETYKSLPRPQQLVRVTPGAQNILGHFRFGGGLAGAAQIVTGAHQWTSATVVQTSSQVVNQASAVVNSAAARDAAVAAAALATSGGRRWSMATQSIAGQSMLSQAGVQQGSGSTGGQGQLASCNSSVADGTVLTPTDSQQAPPSFHTGRRISFVLQDDISMLNGATATLTVAVGPLGRHFLLNRFCKRKQTLTGRGREEGRPDHTGEALPEKRAQCSRAGFL